MVPSAIIKLYFLGKVALAGQVRSLTFSLALRHVRLVYMPQAPWYLVVGMGHFRGDRPKAMEDFSKRNI